VKFVIDAPVALHLAEQEIRVPSQHQLLAPTLIRSQVLSLAHEQGLPQEVVARVRALKLRLLGDAVMQNVAWRLADELGWTDTYAAEYLALTKLQADAFVTLDKKLARAAAKVVPVATLDELLTARPAS
jgi:predicted nucleic acid-binding protein